MHVPTSGFNRGWVCCGFRQCTFDLPLPPITSPSGVLRLMSIGVWSDQSLHLSWRFCLSAHLGVLCREQHLLHRWHRNLFSKLHSQGAPLVKLHTSTSRPASEHATHASHPHRSDCRNHHATQRHVEDAPQPTQPQTTIKPASTALRHPRRSHRNPAYRPHAATTLRCSLSRTPTAARPPQP